MPWRRKAPSQVALVGRRTLVALPLALALLSPPPTHAVPARPGLVEATQPDGSRLSLRGWGDEWRNGVETAGGLTILRDATGRWVLATRLADGSLGPSDVPAGVPTPDGLPRHLRPSAVAAPTLTPHPAPRANLAARAGTHRLLVLLTDFTPSTSGGTTAAQWREHVFTGGPAAPHSVREYWLAASHGRISLEPAAETEGVANDGIVSVTLARQHPDPGGDTDARNQAITREALVAANGFVDYAAFDDDRDGELTTDELHVVVVARGAEAAFDVAGQCGVSVWAHRWCMVGFGSPRLDGVEIADCSAGRTGGPGGGYVQLGEMHCPSGMATIGITAHELGHDLGGGLPDLYDTDEDTRSSGVGMWSLMASGSWNSGSGAAARPGALPALPDAWSRSFLGAVTPEEVDATGALAIPAIQDAPAPSHGVRRFGDNPDGVEIGGAGEYFLVENRQRAGFDAGLPGEGLLIWHVDETARSNDDEGSEPASDRRLVALEQADGRFQLEGYEGRGNDGDAGDPWRSGNAIRFAEDTTPDSRWHGDGRSGILLSGIGASGPIMTAFLGEAAALDGPPSLEAWNVIEPQGGLAEIPLVLSGAQGAGILGLQITLELDSWLTAAVQPDCQVSPGPAAPVGAIVICNNTVPGRLRIVAVHPSAPFIDGTALTARLLLHAGADPGTHALTFAECSATNAATESVAITCLEGSVTIEESCLPGDADDDLRRSVRDLVLLRRQLLSIEPLARPECADADCSGTVTAPDVDAGILCALGIVCVPPDAPGCW